MGPVLPEADADLHPAPAHVDYRAAAVRGERVPRMVAALEQKLSASDEGPEPANGVKHPESGGDKILLEKKGSHTNGEVAENNGILGHAAKDREMISNQAEPEGEQLEDGWETAEAPGSHTQAKTTNSKVIEHLQQEADKMPPILPPPTQARLPLAPPEATPKSHSLTTSTSAKGKSDREMVESNGEPSHASSADAATAAASSEKVQQEEKPTRTFCLVRIPRPDGSIGGAAIREAENRLRDKREKQEFLTVALRLKQISRNEANGKVREAVERLKACREQVKARMDLVKPLWDSQRRLQEAGKMVNAKRRDLPCATEAELDQKIQQLEYIRQHESQSLNEEKKILREIRQLEGSREQVRANSALMSQYTNSGAERESISSQLKPLQEELEVYRAEESEAKKALELVDAEQKELNKGVEELLAQREEAREEHQTAYEELKKLRQQAAQRDNDYYNNRRDIQRFKQLAAQRDIPALEEFSNTQVEGIMAQFSTDAAFRATYVKNNEISTLRRFGSLDTRSPGVDEDPPLLSPTAEKGATKATFKENQDPAKAKSAPTKGGDTAGDNSRKEIAEGKPKVERPKAEGKPKAVAESKPKAAAEAKQKGAAPPPEVAGKTPVPDVGVKTPPPEDKAAKAAIEAEAKERRREEEVRKAREAEERKKRNAEKKAAKVEQRRKREAEEAAKKKDKKKQTTTPPSEAADSDPALAAITEQDSAAPPAIAPDTGAAPVTEEGPRRRQKPVEKKKLKKPPGKNKKFNLQSWLEANWTLVVGVVALLVLVLFTLYFVLNRGANASTIF